MSEEDTPLVEEEVNRNHNAVAGVANSADLTHAQRLRLLFKPFIKYQVDAERDEIRVTVVPESLRTYFYIFFYAYCLLAISVTSIAFAARGEYDKLMDDNLIKGVYGSNNICIYWDDPPFSYMAAFCFLPVIIVLLVYLVFDAVRVYFSYQSGKYPKLTPRFYKTYAGFCVFTGVTFSFFMQSFATQPDQYMPLHAGPFLVATYGLWTLSFTHLLYFLKIDVIKKGQPYYYLGIAYVAAMAVTVVLKTAIDLPNTFGAKSFEQPGWEWTGPLSGINDKCFMVIVTILPLPIYYVFAEDLDHIQLCFKRISIGSKNY